MGEEQSEKIFTKVCSLVKVEIIQKDILADRPCLKLEIAFPAEKVIKETLEKDIHLRLMKEEIDQLAKGIAQDKATIYYKTGTLMLAVFDSLSKQRDEKIFQYYEVKKATVFIEFEFWDWKIKDEI